MSKSSSSVRRVLRARVALTMFVGLPMLFLVGACASRNGAGSSDITGSVNARPARAYSAPVARSKPILSAPRTVVARRTASFRTCDYTTTYQRSAHRFVPSAARRRVASYRHRTVARYEPTGISMYRPHYARDDVTGSIPRSSRFADRWRFNRYPTTNGVFTHVIAPNETLYSIARRYHTSVRELARLNRLYTHSTIRFGDTLIVPRT